MAFEAARAPELRDGAVPKSEVASAFSFQQSSRFHLISDEIVHKTTPNIRSTW
jgi:hypothetical protein